MGRDPIWSDNGSIDAASVTFEGAIIGDHVLVNIPGSEQLIRSFLITVPVVDDTSSDNCRCHNRSISGRGRFAHSRSNCAFASFMTRARCSLLSMVQRRQGVGDKIGCVILLSRECHQCFFMLAPGRGWPFKFRRLSLLTWATTRRLC
jgi:hypothetical protein